MATASTFLWDLELPLPGQDFRNSSKSFRNNKRVKMFEAKVRLIGEEHYPRQILYVTLTFVSFIQNYAMNFIIKEVFYSITHSRDEKCEKFEELTKVTPTHPLTKTFSGHIGIRNDSKKSLQKVVIFGILNLSFQYKKKIITYCNDCTYVNSVS